MRKILSIVIQELDISPISQQGSKGDPTFVSPMGLITLDTKAKYKKISSKFC